MNLQRYPTSRSSTYCENALVATKLEALYLQVLAPSRDEFGEKLGLALTVADLGALPERTCGRVPTAGRKL